MTKTVQQFRDELLATPEPERDAFISAQLRELKAQFAVIERKILGTELNRQTYANLKR